MSINKEATGTATYVKRAASGATTTATPTRVQGSLTEDQAAITQGQVLTPDTIRATQVLSQRSPTPVTTGGGGGGATGGGTPSFVPPTTNTGGTPPTSTTPQTPAGPAAAGAGSAGAASALAGFTEDEISAALAGLEAQYGMTRAQLLADQTQAGAQYRLLLAQLERGRVQGIETATNDAVRRGIYRSGILGENIADVEAATLSGRSQAEAELQAREQATQEQLRGLDAAQQAQAAQIEAQLRRQYAETLLAAGVAPGAGMAAQPAQVQNVPMGVPQVNTQGLQGPANPNVLTTPVAQVQNPQLSAVAPPPPPITTNPSPAYKDPREAEWAYQQYMQMLAQQGINRAMQPVQGLPAGVRAY